MQKNIISDSKLKIAFPMPVYLPHIGGAEVGVHNIATRLAHKGHRPVVIIPFGDYQRIKLITKKLPYELIHFPPKTFSFVARYQELGLQILRQSFKFFQKRNRFDIWHGTFGYPIGVALVQCFSRKKNRVPFIVRCTGEDIQRYSACNYGLRLNNKIDRYVSKWLPKAPKLVAISRSVYDEYKKIGVTDRKIVFIPNGVDILRFSMEVECDSVRKKYHIKPEDFVILCVGRNHPKKGFKYLIQTIPLLLQRGFKRFVIVFVGSKMKALKELASCQKVEKYVRFISPSHSDLSLCGRYEFPPTYLVELYRCADVFVFPSLIETFGIVLIEAMAAGLPVVTTDVPGCRDLVKDGYNGLLTKPANPIDLSEKIIEVSNDNIRHKLVKNGFEFVKKFDWNTVTEQYIELYESLIKF